jgi:hypothetical protein
MSRYIVDLKLDGYETDEEREAAEIEFIKDQLDFSASSVQVYKLLEDELTADTIDPITMMVKV